MSGPAVAAGSLENGAAPALRPERGYVTPAGELFEGIDRDGVVWTAHACFPDFPVGYYGWAPHTDLAQGVTVDFAPLEPAEYFISP